MVWSQASAAYIPKCTKIASDVLGMVVGWTGESPCHQCVNGCEPFSDFKNIPIHATPSAFIPPWTHGTRKSRKTFALNPSSPPTPTSPWRQWHLKSSASHVSHSLKWPRMAYGQQSALFWGLLCKTLKSNLLAEPSSRPAIGPPTSLPLWIVIVIEWLWGWGRYGREGGEGTSDSRQLGNFWLYWAGLHKRQMNAAGELQR